MNDHLKAALLVELQASLKNLNNLPVKIRRTCGLSTESIRLLFGPDVEHRIYRGQQKIFPTMPDYREDYIEIADSLMAFLLNRHARLLYSDQDDHRKVFWDISNVETRFAPKTPFASIKNFNLIREDVQEWTFSRKKATGQQVRVHFGIGHWHTSFNQGGMNLFAVNPIKKPAGFFALAGLMEFQMRIPILFLGPKIVEIGPSSSSAPQNITCHSTLSSSGAKSVVVSRYKTLEVRTVQNAPEQPVAVISRAFEYGLMKYGAMVSKRKLASQFNREGFIELDYIHEMGAFLNKDSTFTHFPNKEIKMGKSGYLSLLVDTINDGLIFEVFDQETAKLLLEDAIARYRNFLSSWNGVSLYKHEEVWDIEGKLSEIENSLGLNNLSQHPVYAQSCDLSDL